MIVLAAKIMKHMPDHSSVTRTVWSVRSWPALSRQGGWCSSPQPTHRDWQLWAEHTSAMQELPAKAEISNGLSIFLP